MVDNHGPEHLIHVEKLAELSRILSHKERVKTGHELQVPVKSTLDNFSVHRAILVFQEILISNSEKVLCWNSEGKLYIFFIRKKDEKKLYKNNYSRQ